MLQMPVMKAAKNLQEIFARCLQGKVGNVGMSKLMKTHFSCSVYYVILNFVASIRVFQSSFHDAA